jgi:hypothetical protein
LRSAPTGAGASLLEVQGVAQTKILQQVIQLDHREDEKPLVWIVEQRRGDFPSPLFVRMMPSAQTRQRLEHLNET